MENKKNRIFVSYSHKDYKWLERLRVHLRPLVREQELDLWDDFRIDPGSNWRDEIQKAIDNANIAILLVSADFLASDFITNNELPPLLKKAEDEGTVIFPVIISPCRFNETKNISQFQAINNPSQPLSSQSRTKHEKVFLELSKHIDKAFSKLELETIEKETIELNKGRTFSENSLIEENIENEFTHVSLLSQNIIQQLNNTFKSGKLFSGLTTGLRELDSFILGLNSPELIAVFAKPYMGLSSFGTTIALNTAVLDNNAVAVFSMEMSKAQMVMQLICAEARVDLHRLNTGYLVKDEWERIGQAIVTLSEVTIFIDDEYGISIPKLRDKLIKLSKETKKIDLVVIDNLQYISSNQKSENRQTQLSQISSELKSLAKEFNIPIVVLCKLPSKLESTLWQRPTLSNLTQLGSISEIADINIILHREEFYRTTEENKGVAQIQITKVQNGITHNLDLAFLVEFNRFENYFGES